MNYYTSQISVPLAEKLKEKGMHQLVDSRMEGWLNSGDNISYAEVFDWMMSRGVTIYIRPCYLTNGDLGGWQPCYRIWAMKAEYTWHEAAEKAIEKALTLI